jgi:hypothetical protein
MEKRVLIVTRFFIEGFNFGRGLPDMVVFSSWMRRRRRYPLLVSNCQ